MPETFTAVEVPVIAKPMGTPEARTAIGKASHIDKNGALFAVEGGCVGADRNGKYWVISPAGEPRALGIGYDHVPNYGGALPTAISPDRKRMLIAYEGKLTELTVADGARRPFGGACVGAAWLDDQRVAIADGVTLAVVTAADGAVLAQRPFAATAPVDLGARADGIVFAAFGDGTKPKTRAIEVFRYADGALEPVGRRAKVPFSYLVPHEGEIYLVEKTAFGDWVKCFRIELAAKPTKK